MSFTETVVTGTLKPDGTLELDQKPELPAGRVTVVLRQEAPAAKEGWWPFMQAVRKRMEEVGCGFLDEKEMQAHIDWLREEDRFDELLRQADQQRRTPESP